MSRGNTKNIGINTAYLAIRKVITLAIAFYSTRLLLSRLGEDDFGLYGLVGSIVVMFSALRGLFSTSIQRFINAAKGGENISEINEIFSIGLKIHVWIALAFFVVVEVAGIFLLPTLNLPQNSYNDGFWVLQFTIFATSVTILTVPYDAIIVANENFKAFSVIAVIESVLKLSIIWGLCFVNTDRVIIYAVMVFGVTIIVRLMNSIYCHYAFGDVVKYNKVRNPILMRKMTTFAGWQFCGNTGYALANSGINLIINIFGGVVVNAARTIAYQLMNAVSQFVGDMNLSFQPQTIISYTSGDISRFRKLVFLNTKAAFIMGLCLCIPLFFCTSGILKIWLGNIPPYTVQFTRWILIYIIIRSLHGPIDMMFKANAQLKAYQLTELLIMSLNLPLSWIVLKLGYPYWSVFTVMCGLEIINLIVVINLAAKQIDFSAIEYFKEIGQRMIIICVIFIILYIILAPITNKVVSLIPLSALMICITIITGVVSFYILLSLGERKSIIQKFVHRFFNTNNNRL